MHLLHLGHGRRRRDPAPPDAVQREEEVRGQEEPHHGEEEEREQVAEVVRVAQPARRGGGRAAPVLGCRVTRCELQPRFLPDDHPVAEGGVPRLHAFLKLLPLHCQESICEGRQIRQHTQ